MVKPDSPQSRERWREIQTLGSHLASRSCNSVMRGYDHEVAFKRPQDLPDFCKKHFPRWSSLVYLGSKKHPQTSHKRARFDGLTSDMLMRDERAFKDTYGMIFLSSELADAAYNCIMNGIMFNMTWDPSNSVIPELHAHYVMDRTNRLYALRCQNGDMSLLLALNEATTDLCTNV